MKFGLFCATIIMTCYANAAMAQQPPASPMEQSLSGKLMEEINQNIQYRAALVQAQRTNDDLQKQVAEFKKPTVPTTPDVPPK
jgi:hypothetical protein